MRNLQHRRIDFEGAAAASFQRHGFSFVDLSVSAFVWSSLSLARVLHSSNNWWLLIATAHGLPRPSAQSRTQHNANGVYENDGHALKFVGQGRAGKVDGHLDYRHDQIA